MASSVTMVALVALVGAGASALAATGTTDVETAAEEKVPTIVWTADMNCDGCHTKEAESGENEACLLAKHTAFFAHVGADELDTADNAGELAEEPAGPTADSSFEEGAVSSESANEANEAAADAAVETTDTSGISCVSCHADEEALAEVHASMKNPDNAPRRLRKTSVVDAACTACHDTQVLAEATAASEALVDGKGSAFNPHDIPQVEAHEDQLTCLSCHKVHSEADLGQMAVKACSKCHHAGIFECYTCHE